MAMIPFSSTNNAGLTEKLECLRGMMDLLKAKADDIHNELRNEEHQARKKRKSEVDLWLKDVSNIEEQVQSIGDVTQVSFLHRGQVSNKLQEMMEHVENLLKRSEFPRGILLDENKPEDLELSTVEMEGSTPSRVQDEVWSCFERGEMRVGIFGIGGVGKTTLAKHINDEILKQKHLFEHVYYVTVSRETSVHKLQSDIAKAVGHSLEYDDELKRAEELRMALAKREKSLLILDDVWEDITMEEVGVSVEGDGCKLLITTRDRGVCRKMKCSPVHMKPLSTDESLDLFKKQLGNFETLPDEVKVTAALVAEQCDGLPLGIVTMARSMRGETDAGVWQEELSRLRNPCTSSHDMENKVFRILKYSYDQLKKEKHRKCFLYCALYPEDYRIKRNELVRHFIAVGLLDGTNRKESIVEGHILLKVLENASLLVAEESGCVKMHGLVRDMAIRIMGSTAMVIERESSEEILGKEEWINKDLKWASLLDNEMDHIGGMIYDCPNISALLLRGALLMSISNSFFLKMVSLKVLDLSHTYVEKLPRSISDLINLNALLLCDCHHLQFIPSLAKLAKLRDLNLDGCFKLSKLPEGLEELASLEHLDLRKTGIAGQWCYFHQNLESFLGNDKIIFPPEELMRLNHLMILTGVHFKDVSEFNRCVDLGVFNQLETYHVSIGYSHYTTNCCELEEKIDDDDDDDDDAKLIKAICLNGVSGGEECLLFPQNVSRLEFSKGSFGSRCLLGDFPSLVDATTTDLELCCSAHDFDCIIPEWWTKPLQRIRTLELQQIEEFGGLIREGVVYPYISFSGLKVLRICSCPKLKKLWMLNLDLPNLEDICIENCGQMEEIFATESGGTVQLPRLHSLVLLSLPELRSIWGNCEVLFPHLISLVVSRFPKMKKIGRVSRNLSSLKTISISDCKEIEEIFAAEDEEGDDQIHLPKLEDLHLDDLPQLRSISRQTIVCNSLQKVSIEAGVDGKIHLPKMENCPISVPNLSVIHNSGPLPVLTAFNLPEGWWESLHWNDPATHSLFHQLGCFHYTHILSDTDSSTLEDKELEAGGPTPRRKNKETVSSFSKSEVSGVSRGTGAGIRNLEMREAVSSLATSLFTDVVEQDLMEWTSELHPDQLQNDSVMVETNEDLRKDKMAMVPSSSTNNSSLHEELEILECLKEMMLQLNTKASDIQNEVQNEELQARKKIKSEVTLWLQQVSSFEEQVQSVGREVAQVSFSHRGRLSKKLQGMVECVEQLLKQSEFPRGLLLDDFKPEGLELVTQKMEGSTPGSWVPLFQGYNINSDILSDIYPTPRQKNKETVSLFSKSEENESAAGSAAIMPPDEQDSMEWTSELDPDQLLNDSVMVETKEGLPKDTRIPEAMKECCSIFFLVPEEHEIERDTLIQLWMAVGYVVDEPMGHVCFDYLLNEEYLSHSGSNS